MKVWRMRNKMKKIVLGDVIVLTVVVLFVIAFGLISQENVRLKQERQELKDEIQELNREIGELQSDLAWMDDYLDLIEEIYEGKINEAVLEERIKWLENEKTPKYVYDDYVNQILVDFDDVMEITIHYYENTDQAVDLVTYIEINYPTLYKRLLSYT